jgi:hypothetical protein
MDDEPKIFHGKKYIAMASEARGVLILLGFDGVRDFAQRAGVNHETAGQLLGTVKLKYHKKHGLLVRAHEALHTAYVERREQMSRPMRNYVRDWAKRWRLFALDEVLWLRSPGRGGAHKYPSEAKRMKQRREAIKLGVQQALEALKWE